MDYKDKVIELIKSKELTSEQVTKLENIFPELAESEDERIRKALMQNLKERFGTKGNMGEGLDMPDILAWLEKQGEQKPQGKSALEAAKEEKIDNANKVEPKFKVGDIITNGEIIGKVDENENNKYHGWFGYDKDLSVHCADIPDVENWHLWTIQDAKDGDVLSWDDSKCIALFKNIYDEESFNSYGLVGHCTGTFELRQSYHDIEGAHPATKEQRDLLFQKMKEAGYEWDAEKKGLKKISQEYPLTPDECIKSSWSEEDERKKNKLIWIFEEIKKGANYFYGSDVKEIIDWLKSLRPQNWTKEDKERYISCLQRLGTGNPEQPETINSKWFKEHVYPQSSWKLSNEQMEALEHFVRSIGESGYASPYDNNTKLLYSLLEQLKKLREEQI